jgi:hypothetical protein
MSTGEACALGHSAKDSVKVQPPSIPGEVNSAFEPSADTLLDRLRERVDDEILEEIAGCDYDFDAPDNLRELRRIRDTGKTPAPMTWNPEEVLCLTRWSEPDERVRDEAKRARGHVMRAFACAALLRAAAEPANRDANFTCGENDTLAQLLASANVLGPEIMKATGQFLAWRTPQLEMDEARPFFAFGLLSLAAAGERSQFPEALLGRLAEWVVEEEAWNRTAQGQWFIGQRTRWLLGLTVYDQRSQVWVTLGARLRKCAAQLQSKEVSVRLADIANRLGA